MDWLSNTNLTADAFKKEYFKFIQKRFKSMKKIILKKTNFEKI